MRSYGGRRSTVTDLSVALCFHFHFHFAVEQAGGRHRLGSLEMTSPLLPTMCSRRSRKTIRAIGMTSSSPIRWRLSFGRRSGKRRSSRRERTIKLRVHCFQQHSLNGTGLSVSVTVCENREPADPDARHMEPRLIVKVALECARGFVHREVERLKKVRFSLEGRIDAHFLDPYHRERNWFETFSRAVAGASRSTETRPPARSPYLRRRCFGGRPVGGGSAVASASGTEPRGAGSTSINSLARRFSACAR